MNDELPPFFQYLIKRAEAEKRRDAQEKKARKLKIKMLKKQIEELKNESIAKS